MKPWSREERKNLALWLLLAFGVLLFWVLVISLVPHDWLQPG